jgi:hypothetical protein
MGVSMGKHRIFSATLGLTPPWKITSVGFSEGSNRMDIHLEVKQEKTLICPVCGAEGTTGEQDPQPETWFHDDFLCYATYLHALVPTLECRCGKFPLERPWNREGSRFSRCPESAPDPDQPWSQTTVSKKAQ